MIDPQAVAFDIDGVIADTMRLFLEIARQEYQLHDLRYEDMTTYTLASCLSIEQATLEEILQRIMNGNYTATLRPLAGAAKALTRLSRHQQPILLITARPHAGPMRAWTRQLLPKTPAAFEIIATGSFEAKTEILLQHQKTFFVEDRLETCFLLQQAGITPILFRQPWNRQPHPFVEVDSWHELELLLDYSHDPEQPH